MNEDYCKLCKRNKILSITFLNSYDFNNNRFDNEICELCNCYHYITGVRKPVTDFDVKRLNFILFMLKKFRDYYNDERRIQQRDDIGIWKNDKYLRDWYDHKYGKDLKRFKQFKLVFFTYFDNKADISSDTWRINFKTTNEKLIISWLYNNYYTLKNEVKWN